MIQTDPSQPPTSVDSVYTMPSLTLVAGYIYAFRDSLYTTT
jgi:hypothetical protein